MKIISRKLLLLTVLLSGTQVITLPFTEFSIFQIVLIITGVVSIVTLFVEGGVKRGQYLWFSIILGVSSYWAYSRSTNPSWAESYLLLGLMFTMLVLVFPNFFTQNDFHILTKTLIRSQYIVIPFSIYSFYKFYYGNGIPNHVPLFGGMYINLDADTLLRTQASSQVRFTLPYSTPPILSVVMAMCLIILLFDKSLYKKSIRWILIIVYAIIFLLTGSRTGMAGMIIFFLVYALSQLKRKHTISLRKVIFIPIVFCSLIIVIGFSMETVYIQKMIQRFLNINIMADRHFLVPLDGLLIWTDSFENFFKGIGFGSSINLAGAHTYLPAYFLNSFVTLVAERGIMGLALVLFLIILAGRCFFYRRLLDDSQLALCYALLTGLFSSIFYETLNCYFLIFVIAICFLLDLELKKIQYSNRKS